MGVKSTVTLTRREAEELYVEKRLDMDALKRQIRAEAVLMNDVELENMLEKLNDAPYYERYGHSGYDNYLIREEY
jgi:hypothetical protein